MSCWQNSYNVAENGYFEECESLKLDKFKD